MQIVGALPPPTVNIHILQRRVLPVGLQPTPETERVPGTLRPERTVIPAASVSRPVPATPQSTSTIAALQRQLFEFGLRIVTGAFSRLVTDVLGLKPAVSAQQAVEKPAMDNPQESVSPTATISPHQTPTVAPIPVATASVNQLNQSVTKEGTPQALTQAAPARTTTLAHINPKNVQAVVIPPLILPQTPEVTPIPPIIAAVSEIARSSPIPQHKRRRLDIFDTQVTSRNHAARSRMQLGNHLDRTV